MEYYSYPRIYVETEEVDGGECIVEVGRGEYAVVECGLKKDSHRVFKKRVYERSHFEVLDLEGGIVTRSFIIYSPRTNSYLLVEEGVKAYVLEVGGMNVFFYKYEGEKVEEGEVVAEEVSRKGEVRVVRSPSSGVIVLIGDYVEAPQRYLLVIAGGESVKRISVRRG